MYNFDLGRPASVYFCGIGGVSMSGLALILKSRGFRVSGSDRAKSAVTENLEAQGIRVFYGQKKENITPGLDLMVFTAAIHPDNPEFVAAEAYGIPMMTRAELLGLIMKDYELPVAVSGTHGKTTTTSMLSEILLAQDTDPTLSVGGNLRSIGGNVRIGGPKYFVAEACEYTNSFLSMFPKYGIILDIDADHLDFFKDLDDIRRSFRKFAELLPADGALIIHSDIERLGEITEGLACRVFTYGNGADDDYQVRSLTFDDHGHPSFVFHIKKSGKDVPVALSVPGEHNAFNACAALAAADLLGMDAAASAEAVGNYRGADRRFEILGERDGVLIVDDYAHHPTEIRATLTAAQNTPHDRIFCVFQPHTYSRTKSLFEEFADALSIADVVVLADIYAARETDTLGVSSHLLAERIREKGHPACHDFRTFEEIEKFVLENCRKGDLLITMGAGNVNTVAKDLLS